MPEQRMRLSSWKLEAIAPVAGASRARLPVQSRRIRGNIRLPGTLQRKHALFSKHYLKWLLRSRSPQLTRDRDPSRYVPGTVLFLRMLSAGRNSLLRADAGKPRDDRAQYRRAGSYPAAPVRVGGEGR